MLAGKKHYGWCVTSLGLVLIALFSSVLFAQMGMMRGPSPLAGLFHPRVGYGAVYLVTDSHGQTSETQIYVVGKEDVAGTTAYWLEIVMAGESRRGGEMVMKYLMAPQSTGVKVYRVIMKNPEMGAMEMPEMMVSHMSQNFSQNMGSSEKDLGKNLGAEALMTKLGPKKCTHWQRESQQGTTDLWIANDVYPVAVVKRVTKTQNGSHTMELIRVLTDAKTKITETPQKMNFPGMPDERPPGE